MTHLHDLLHPTARVGRDIDRLARGIDTGETSALIAAAVELNRRRRTFADDAASRNVLDDESDPVAVAALLLRVGQETVEAHLRLVERVERTQRRLLILIPLAFVVGALVAIGALWVLP